MRVFWLDHMGVKQTRARTEHQSTTNKSSAANPIAKVLLTSNADQVNYAH
jgi:hypothetical protein